MSLGSVQSANTLPEVGQGVFCSQCSKFFLNVCFMTVAHVEQKQVACLYFIPRRASVDNGQRRRVSDQVKP